MAQKEETKNEEAEAPEEGQPKKSKKGMLLGGGIVGLVAAAYMVSLAALPGKTKAMPFEGPFVVDVSQGELHVNLASEGGKRFLVMTLQAEYDAYDATYATVRVTDPLYQAKLKDVLIRLGRKKSKADLDDGVGEDVFKSEIRDAVDPLLFPIHVGNELNHTQRHEESGLRAGASSGRATMRGGFQAHVLHVDAPRRAIRLDDGAEMTFTGSERDLEVVSAEGLIVFIDVSELTPEFVGEVHVGVFGHVRDVLFGKFLVQ